MIVYNIENYYACHTCQCNTKPGEAQKINILVGNIQEQPMALVMTATQQVDLTIQPLDAKGNPAPVDGIPEWAVANPAIGSITPDSTGLKALFKATAIGDTQVSVTADADLGSGVRNLTGTIDISVRAAEAVSIGIVAGTPVEQP